MNIEVLLTEAEIADEFAESIEARDLPEKFFFWSQLSVRAWKALSSISQASLLEIWEQFAARAPELTKAFGDHVPVISFGAGDGIRDRMVLRSLMAAGRAVKYYPVDASQTFLESACSGAEDDDCEALGIKADISSPVHLLLAADVVESPRLFFMTGNTLGGFDPLEQLKHVAECVKKGDLLIVDCKLPSDEVQPSEEQKRFVFAPLAGIGVTPEDGDLEFLEKPDDRLEGLSIQTRRFQASRDLELMTGTRTMNLARGERILLNFRYMCSAEAFRWLIMEQAGLRIVGEMPSSDGRFMTAACIRA
jgi:uncharacterized SAM-dependent methyltransferase